MLTFLQLTRARSARASFPGSCRASSPVASRSLSTTEWPSAFRSPTSAGTGTAPSVAYLATCSGANGAVLIRMFWMSPEDGMT